jgi:type I restriction enzyme M protein
MSVRNTVKSIQDTMRQDVGVDGDAQRISQLCWMFFLKILDDQDAQLELMDPTYASPLTQNLRWISWAANPEGMTGNDLLNFINNTLFPQLKSLAPVGTQAHRQRVVRAVFEDAYNYMKSGHLRSRDSRRTSASRPVGGARRSVAAALCRSATG